MKLLETIIEKHLTIMNWGGVILCSWVLSIIATQIIAVFLPAPSFASSVTVVENSLENFATNRSKDVAYYIPICERNIFDADKKSPCVKTAPDPTPFVDNEPRVDPNAAPVKSSINAELKGTTVFGNPALSFATISEAGKKETENYKVDDKILNRARIYEIVRNRVYFFNNGRREYLEIEGPDIYSESSPAPVRRGSSGAGVQRDGNNITVSRNKVDSVLSNMNQVLQDARMVPNYSNGSVDGFKIFGIRNQSIFQELGLRNGDVINQVNGNTVDSLEKALPMLQMLKTESNFEISISRRGQKQTLKIQVQ